MIAKERVEHQFYTVVDWLLSWVGVELVLTCKFCRQEIEVTNIVSHISWHKKRRDTWLRS